MNGNFFILWRIILKNMREKCKFLISYADIKNGITGLNSRMIKNERIFV